MRHSWIYVVRPSQKAQNKRNWSRSYINLTGAEFDKHSSYTAPDPEGGIVSWISKMSVPTVPPPYFAGAAKSPLLNMLDEGHHDVKISTEEYHKLAAWMDLLVPYSGEYREGHDWAAHEMKKYDYYEEKRRQQYLEERNQIADFIQRTGLNDIVTEQQEAAPFTRTSFQTVWATNRLQMTAGEALPFQGERPFVFDRITLRVETTAPVQLHLRNGDEIIHTFEFKPGAETAFWHIESKALRSSAVSLLADQTLTLSTIKVEGVPEADLPEWQGYQPYLAHQK